MVFHGLEWVFLAFEAVPEVEQQLGQRDVGHRVDPEVKDPQEMFFEIENLVPVEHLK